MCVMQLYSSQFRGKNFAATCSRIHRPDDIVLAAIICMYAYIIISGFKLLVLLLIQPRIINIPSIYAFVKVHV